MTKTLYRLVALLLVPVLLLDLATVSSLGAWPSSLENRREGPVAASALNSPLALGGRGRSLEVWAPGVRGFPADQQSLFQAEALSAFPLCFNKILRRVPLIGGQWSGIRKASSGPRAQYLNVLETYEVPWNSEKIARDLLQNFFDSNDLTLDQVHITATPLKEGYRVRIEGAANFDWRKLIHFGGTDKNMRLEAAGGVGEGAKIASFCLLKQAAYGIHAVMFGSTGWTLRYYLDTPPRDSYDVPQVRGLYAEIDETVPREKGSFVEFDTTNQKLADHIIRARDLFYHSANPDFRNPTYEGAHFGYRYLGPGNKGHFYEAGQRRHVDSNNDWDGVMGLHLWSRLKVSERDRDRGMIGIFELRSRVIQPMVEEMSEDELIHTVYTIVRHDFSGNDWEAHYELLAAAVKQLHGKGVVLTFDEHFLADDVTDMRATRALVSAGFKLFPRMMADIGMKKASDKFPEVQQRSHLDPTAQQIRRLDILHEAVRRLMITLNDHPGKKIENKDIWLYSMAQEKGVVLGQYSEEFVGLAEEVINGAFEVALATYLHELDHRSGRDGSDVFSDALTETMEQIIHAAARNQTLFLELQNAWNADVPTWTFQDRLHAVPARVPWRILVDGPGSVVTAVRDAKGNWGKRNWHQLIPTADGRWEAYITDPETNVFTFRWDHPEPHWESDVKPEDYEYYVDRTAAASPKTGITGLFDELLVAFFHLELFGWVAGHPVADAIFALLAYTAQEAIPLADYHGQYAEPLHEAIESYATHKNAPQVNQPLDVDIVRIIPESPDKGLPYLPWHALVYVDGETIVIHEAFLDWLKRNTQTPGQFIMYLTEVLGHENAERKLPDKLAATHKEALRLFPLTRELEEALSNEGPLVAPPLRGTDAIWIAYQSLRENRITADVAAAAVAEALKTLPPTGTIPTEIVFMALQILIRSQDPKWKPLMDLLVYYSQQKDTSELVKVLGTFFNKPSSPPVPPASKGKTPDARPKAPPGKSTATPMVRVPSTPGGNAMLAAMEKLNPQFGGNALQQMSGYRTLTITGAARDRIMLISDDDGHWRFLARGTGMDPLAIVWNMTGEFAASGAGQTPFTVNEKPDPLIDIVYRQGRFWIILRDSFLNRPVISVLRREFKGDEYTYRIISESEWKTEREKITGPDSSDPSPAAPKEIDPGISSKNQAGKTRQDHLDYHEKGRFAEVLKSIVSALLGTNIISKEDYERFIRGNWHNFKALLEYRYTRGEVEEKPGGVITLKLGSRSNLKFSIHRELDGIVVIIDPRFGADHAGRSGIVFARDEKMARHELAELHQVARWALDNHVASRNDILQGRLGSKIREYLNNKLNVSGSTLKKRQKAFEKEMEMAHAEGIRAEKPGYKSSISKEKIIEFGGRPAWAYQYETSSPKNFDPPISSEDDKPAAPRFDQPLSIDALRTYRGRVKYGDSVYTVIEPYPSECVVDGLPFLEIKLEIVKGFGVTMRVPLKAEVTGFISVRDALPEATALPSGPEVTIYLPVGMGGMTAQQEYMSQGSTVREALLNLASKDAYRRANFRDVLFTSEGLLRPEYKISKGFKGKWGGWEEKGEGNRELLTLDSKLKTGDLIHVQHRSSLPDAPRPQTPSSITRHGA